MLLGREIAHYFGRKYTAEGLHSYTNKSFALTHGMELIKLFKNYKVLLYINLSVVLSLTFRSKIISCFVCTRGSLSLPHNLIRIRNYGCQKKGVCSKSVLNQVFCRKCESRSKLENWNIHKIILFLAYVFICTDICMLQYFCFFLIFMNTLLLTHRLLNRCI